MIATGSIQRLPQAVADAIAAGEVVERPASVVKELMENAIDAGARHVEIDVEGGGLARIQVVDDGDGIAAAELPLAVARHATSKIQVAADLAAVRTLGFRGEALASIAAVSDLQLASRSRGATAGAWLRVRGGTPAGGGPEAMAQGTRVEVRELFATTPARLRFLRGERAEAAAARRVAAELALAQPGVAVTCRTDGRRTLATPGTSLAAALRAVVGDLGERDLVAVEAEGSVRVHGYLTAPHRHQGTRAGLVLVVNGRRVQSRALLAAVDEACRGLLPAGRHPIGALHLEVDPASVDVNVHPAKREVRFASESAVFVALQRACWEALRGGPAAIALGLLGEPAGAAEPEPAGAPSGSGVLVLRDGEGPIAPFRGLFDVDQGQHLPAAAADAELPAAADGIAQLAPLRALGQAGSSWILAAAPQAVVIVDPHAAHEKALYMELRQRWERGEGAAGSQLLLLPAVVECDPARLERLEASWDLVASCGFAVEPFGPGLVRCTAVPAAGTAADPSRLLAELLDVLADATDPGELRHRLAALVACHGAVRFGDSLDPAAQQALLDTLLRTEGAMTCPHGRPTLIVLEDGRLRRAFRRPA